MVSEPRASVAQVWDCVVIGSGISGLLAADRIQASGSEVLVVDKARQVGGRMATRRIGAARFDHGAQFFTCRTPEFAFVVRDWQEAGVARSWCLGFGPQQDGHHHRYRCCPGMTAGPKQLAARLSARLRTRIERVIAGPGTWEVIGEDGFRAAARMLVASPPVPQTLDLLRAGGTQLSVETNAEFTRTLAKVLHRPAMFPLPGLALQTVFGEMARELLLSSARVRPVRLEESGFEFRFRSLDTALRHATGGA